MGKIKFGWAEIDITPKDKIALAGEFFERATNEVETPITMTALAIESDGEQAVFCSCDLVSVNDDLLAETRRKLKAPGLDPKNVMLNAIQAAQHKHTFIYRGWEAHSQGNPYAHAILRGSTNKHGQAQPNYHYEDLVLIDEFYHERGLQNPAVVVDVNHANSNKQYIEQIRIAKEVMHSRRYNDSIRKLVKGLMIESYLVDGAQKVDGGVYGQSITDPCLGWEKTERLVLDLAEMV